MKDIAADLEVAFPAALRDMAPADPGLLHTELTRFVGLVGQNWSGAGRAEFIALAIAELDELPGGLVLDALRRARRRVTDGRFLISWVMDDVEPQAAKLATECEQLQRLAELAASA